MKYSKPEIKIEKFSLVENIMADGTSVPDFEPIIDENDDPLFEIMGDIIGRLLSE